MLVVNNQPNYPDYIVPARLIGVLEAEQTENCTTTRNDRLMAVVETPCNPAEYATFDDVSLQRLDEMRISLHRLQ